MRDKKEGLKMKKVFLIIVIALLFPTMALCDTQIGGGGSFNSSNVTITGGTIAGTTITTSSLTAYDTLSFTIDAGIDSVLGAPNAATKLQGVVGSTINPTAANVTYVTKLSQPYRVLSRLPILRQQGRKLSFLWIA
jgi:hypothetical protein